MRLDRDLKVDQVLLAHHALHEWNRHQWACHQLLPDPLIEARMEAGAEAQQVESAE